MAGGSWGAQLAAAAALAGAAVSGVIALYGYYGNTGRLDELSRGSDGIRRVVPPFLIVHGTLDTLVLREDARRFAGRLNHVSQQPVVYAELPGAQHNFDFFHSLRAHAVADAVERFADVTVAAGKPVEQTPSPTARDSLGQSVYQMIQSLESEPHHPWRK